MEAAAAIAVATKLVGAYGSYQTGKIQKKLFEIKSRDALLRTDQEFLKERQKGIQVLDKILATQAAINARAGAGAMDPYSGTSQALRVFATAEGMKDFQITRDNAALIEQVGILKSIDYKQAGSMAMYQARLNTLTQIGEAAFAYSQIGKPTPPQETTPISSMTPTYGGGPMAVV